MGERLVSNGIDPRTGEPLVDIDEDELAELIAGTATEHGRDPIEDLGTDPRKALPWDTPPTDLAKAGWSIVFAADEDPAVREALHALIEHRRAHVAEDNLHVHDHMAGEDAINWLARHHVNPGAIDPSRVGYYVLLVGSPERIPFEFQYLLDIEYAVGRLHFDTPDDYRHYAASVIACESGGSARRDRTAVFWGPRHSWDPATNLSAEQLLGPLANGRDGKDPIASRQGFRSVGFIGETATKRCLLDLLTGRQGDAGRPALLVTASHGLGGLAADDPDQRLRHGALVTPDWKRGPVPTDATVGGADVEDGKAHGMLAFVFACYGAGTPAFDDFPRQVGKPAPQIAPAPFVAHLPKTLMANPDGGVLATIGHVERAWGYSITSTGGTQIRRFEDVIGQLLAGIPVGHSMKVFNEAYAVLAAALAEQLRQTANGRSIPPRQLLALWMERTDAQNYVVLGDPAVKLHA